MPKRRLKTTTDLRRYLAMITLKVERGEIDTNLGGKLGYLCSILHRLIEGSDLEERVIELEKAVNNKGDNVFKLRQA